MPKALRYYFGVVVGLAVAFCATLDWSILARWTTAEWAGLSSFLLVAVLTQVFSVDSTVGASKPLKSSIAFLPLMALAVVMPVPAVVLATGSTLLVFEVLRERSIPRTLFNVSQTILSYGLAATVFGWIVHTDSANLFASGITSVFFAFIALALTFFGLNFGFVSGVLALRQRERLGSVIRQVMGKGGGNLVFGLFASPVALVAAYLYHTFYIGGLLAAVLPFLVIRYSYLSSIRLEQANRDLLKVLVKAIETRDPYTSGHSLRVSNLAQLIASDLGLRPSVIEHIETAALLHDIGKIDSLFATIISKPTELTEQERNIIRTHATKGADILDTLTSLDRDVIDGVRHHHEMFDGTGYPDGLRGKDIPLAARIIMICDAVDAMLSDRPYRQALTVSQVRSELQRCAGTQFDPSLVRTILDRNTLERAQLLVDLSGARTPLRAAVSI